MTEELRARMSRFVLIRADDANPALRLIRRRSQLMRGSQAAEPREAPQLMFGSAEEFLRGYLRLRPERL